MYGGCDTCNHSWGETKCMGCLWDGKSRTNTHWEPKEPFINKPCVSEGACHEDKMKVLEKIRAELERRGGNDEKAFCKSLNESYKLGLREAIEIIDKYMVEDEDK